ncbi:SRPBCC family protein [Serinicoccus kebangsaanensis]|uniref:SRPBCC family protein n=1 Tax=Serinicoccus kebangsaanensis TaxID=2602069 RepID=UPI00124D23CF|nr:SRPBCC family protein [Serinicoccus kebangsaanensis]
MELTHRTSLDVDAPAQTVYALVSDVTRTGEWSPTCRSCEWDDPAQQGVGAQFSGHNETTERRWSTRSTVVAAVPGREFAWEVGQGYVRWAYLLTPREGGTELTHTWEFTDAGQRYFEQTYRPDAPAQIAQRTAAAREDMPRTLAAIRDIAERDHADR